MATETNRTPRQFGPVEASLFSTMKAIVVLLLLLVITSTPYARIWEVSVGTSIQAAVDSSSRGDSIVLEEGHYYETVLIRNKNLTLGSLYLLDSDTCHVAMTIIEPSITIPDTESCFVAMHNDTGAVYIMGLTFYQGLGSFWRFRNSHFNRGGGPFWPWSVIWRWIIATLRTVKQKLAVLFYVGVHDQTIAATIACRIADFGAVQRIPMAEAFIPCKFAADWRIASFVIVARLAQAGE